MAIHGSNISRNKYICTKVGQWSLVNTYSLSMVSNEKALGQDIIRSAVSLSLV